MVTASSLVVAARRRAGLTQAELASRSGVPQPNVSAIERGRTTPKPETLARLNEAARVRPSVVRERLREQVLASAAAHRIGSVWVFGSAVHGTDTVDSDIDLLVEPRDDTDLFDLTAFQLEVTGLLGCHVDVVSTRSTGRAMPRIRRESVPL